MNITHLVNAIRNTAALVTKRKASLEQLALSVNALGQQVFDHFEHQDIIDHPITLREGNDTYELALVEESPGTFMIMCSSEPRVHVYFELYEGKFQIRFYPEGMDADDAGQQIYAEQVAHADAP